MTASPSTPKKQKAKKIPFSQFRSLLKDRSESDLKEPVKYLASLGLNSPLMFVGSEALRMQRITEWFCETIFSSSDKSTSNASRFLGTQIKSTKDLERFSHSLHSLSLFSQSNLIILSEAQDIKAAQAKPLAEALKSHPSSSFVIVLTQKINQQTPLPNALKSFATVVELAELKGAHLKKWILQEAKQCTAAGIEDSALELMTRCYGNDLATISSELKKLSLLVGKNEKITKAVLQQVLLKSPEHTSFELLTQISLKNALACEKLTSDLLAQGFHPLQVSAFLSRAFRMLLTHKNPHAGEIPGGLCKDLSNQWFLKNLRPALARYSEKELLNAVEIIKDLDFELKSSKFEPQQVLNTAVLRLALRQPQPLAA